MSRTYHIPHHSHPEKLKEDGFIHMSGKEITLLNPHEMIAKATH